MNINRTLCIGLALLLVATLLSAQENTPRTAQGDRALLFSINGFGDFGVSGSTAARVGSGGFADSGSGSVGAVYGIGAKYFIAPKNALRLAIGLGMTSQSGDSMSGGASSTAVGLSGAYEIHLVQTGPVTGYVGGFAAYGSRSTSNGGEGFEYGSTTSSISLGAMLGVEFFAWSSLSFGAEYQLGLRMNSSSTSAAGSTNDGPGTTEIGIGTVAVSLGVYL